MKAQRVRFFGELARRGITPITGFPGSSEVLKERLANRLRKSSVICGERELFHFEETGILEFWIVWSRQANVNHMNEFWEAISSAAKRCGFEEIPIAGHRIVLRAVRAAR